MTCFVRYLQDRIDEVYDSVFLDNGLEKAFRQVDLKNLLLLVLLLHEVETKYWQRMKR